MKRTILAATAALALTLAGVGTAAVLTRHVTLHSGACVTVAKTRVCAAKAATVIRTRLLTVTTPGQTVTLPPVTVTVTAPTAPPPTTTAPASPVTENFSGDGDTEIAAFSTPVGETLTWTSNWPNGVAIGDPHGDFALFDNATSGWTGPDSNSGSGSTFLPAGSHQFSVVDESGADWTIHVG